jgi:UDP-3-O-[3-hydroxymyristoyl] glucosamine N-acyltransferase
MGKNKAEHPPSGPVFSLRELAEKLGGRLQHDSGNTLISGIAAVFEARPGQITFLTDTKFSGKYFESLKSTKASAVIASTKAPIDTLPVIQMDNPYEGLRKALLLFHPVPPCRYTIHPTAFVHEDARVDPSAIIGPNAVVEEQAEIGPGTRLEAQVFVGRGARIGAGTHLHPQVVVREACIIGDRTIINCGTVIGSDGFGFYRDANGHQKVPQVGIVQIGSDVEIGANVTIDRATMGKTEIGDGTKIDNLVQIAHNVKIGRRCLVVAQVGISGSTILEDDVTLAGQVGTVGHVRIGRGTTVAARGVVTQDVEPNSLVSGFPLKPHTEEKKILAALRKLPEMMKTVRRLEATIADKGE